MHLLTRVCLVCDVQRLRVAVFRVCALVFERFPLVVIRFVVCLEKGAFVVCFLLLDVCGVGVAKVEVSNRCYVDHFPTHPHRCRSAQTLGTSLPSFPLHPVAELPQTFLYSSSSPLPIPSDRACEFSSSHRENYESIPA